MQNFNDFWFLDKNAPESKKIIQMLNKKFNLDIESPKFECRFKRVSKQKAREILENPEVDF